MRQLETVSSRAGISEAVEKVDRLQRAIETVIKGKPESVRLAIVTLIAGGHLLVEDVPGVGKTSVAKRLVKLLPNAVIVDPEHVGFVVSRTRIGDFQDAPAWRR